MRVTLAAFVIGLSLVGSSPPLLGADDGTSTLIDELAKSPDHRVRGHAALSLGVGGRVESVKPLCRCLGDHSEVDSVRVSCAAAIGKLAKLGRPGAEACLRATTKEPSLKVSSAVAEAIKTSGSNVVVTATTPTAVGCSRPPAVARLKYYVGIAISNKSARPDGDVKAIVEREVKCQLSSTPGYLVALGEETSPANMTEVVDKQKLSGYFLSVAVEPIKYESGNLRVSVRMVVMTHTRDLKGELSTSATFANVKTFSRQSEETLIAAATQRLMEDWVGVTQ